MLFPHHSHTVEQRQSFSLKVKRCLRPLGVEYSLLFLSHVKIISSGTTTYFTESKEFWDWTDQYRGGHPRQRSESPPDPSLHRLWRKAKARLNNVPGPPTTTYPDLEQIIEDRNKALKAAANLGSMAASTDEDTDPHIFTSEDDFTASDDTRQDSQSPPLVTPQTVENLV
ncbi:hypothetical protein NDU88_003615 [Pleurodeles waltl]|uniref:Uncharacterized protein n=1 Tax=Pleurodeles waltl TaxID=8319 RepID=A0AAV7M3W8_PLEWA|nr:hypothetical protein NDU88_003615 [Pleurodeles waltl]